MTTRRALPLLLILIALLAAACAPPEEAPTPTPIPRPVSATNPTYEVKRGDVTVPFQFTGRITPILQEELFFRTDGFVRSIFVSEGDTVTPGQLLADLNIIDDLERQKALDALAVQRAQVALEIAQLNLQLTSARADPVTRDIEVAIKDNQVKLAQFALDEALLNVRDLDTAIANAQIAAPFDGEVLSMSIEEGDDIEAFEAVLVVADLSALEVSSDLRRQQIDQLAEGMTARVTPYNRPGEAIDGYIRRLPYGYGEGSSTSVESLDTSVRVALEVLPTDVGLELSERVQVTVILEHQEDVLWLPPQAVRSFEGRRFVVVQDGNARQRVDVTLGIQSSDRVEIVEGLSEGQIVVGP